MFQFSVQLPQFVVDIVVGTLCFNIINLTFNLIGLLCSKKDYFFLNLGEIQ